MAVQAETLKSLVSRILTYSGSDGTPFNVILRSCGFVDTSQRVTRKQSQIMFRNAQGREN